MSKAVVFVVACYTKILKCINGFMSSMQIESERWTDAAATGWDPRTAETQPRTAGHPTQQPAQGWRHEGWNQEVRQVDYLSFELLIMLW